MSKFRVHELKEGLKIADLFFQFSNELKDVHKALFRKKILKILLSYWQKIAGMNTSFHDKLKWLKVVNRYMSKVSAETFDVTFFTHKESLIFRCHSSVLAFIAYYLFRKYIKRNV